MLDAAISAFHQGHIIAYPTEAVFGLGCDPRNEAAVHALLKVKQRPIEKGLILVAASIPQLLPYIAIDELTEAQRETVFATWPGPHTWIVPKNASTPHWLSGQFDTIAVRVSAHPVVQRLCSELNQAVVSTSANLTGLEPCISADEVAQQLGERVDVIVSGECGPSEKPTQIRDARTLAVVRAS
ncbi:L-threonylcarbamoyladenylate synthase [Echinimonas agarilytica]|uniref:Threonylcarbamoyl-AMP synthase n=1 Tax=Echinimonas agarilytica TaxID=1215918 RepID=A0AA42B648_9GAMM|nr:L-threonylcarbamoyladenylate synthase [Echinimonas agarilytica]MCM2678056.1 L-threonylcarbamoyladenylate synthase [Echinimonas agarilytica]